MQFLTPIAFALSALFPIIIALYFLKLRRQDYTVSSTYLWQDLVRDTVANAPWQRLRPNILLLLQLLFLGALILAQARPFTWTHAVTGEHLILLIDTSASMAATDITPNRLQVATDEAQKLAANLPSNVPVTLIAVHQEVQIRLSASKDRQQLDRALADLRPNPGDSDMPTALELASALAASESDTQIVILSDGGAWDTPMSPLLTHANVQYISVGVAGRNQAISALALNTKSSAQELSAFVRVVNYDTQTAKRRLTLYAHADTDNTTRELVTARDLTLTGGETSAFTIPDLPPDTIAIEAHLSPNDTNGMPDDLTADDAAWAVAPALGRTHVRIVGPGNRFLETALRLMSSVDVTTITFEDYEAQVTTEASTDRGDTANSTSSLTIFDSVLPTNALYFDNAENGALLFIGPLHSTRFFSVTGEIDLPRPAPARDDEPVLRFVDLRDIAIQKAARIPLPTWGRPVIINSTPQQHGEKGTPLMIVGEHNGHRLGILAFDLRHSDLPLRVAFPLLLANTLDYLAPRMGTTIPETVPPGQPLVIPLPPQAKGARLTYPDGHSSPLSIENGTTRVEDTHTYGIYHIAWEADGITTPLGHFAVNAYHPQESDIAPSEPDNLLTQSANSNTGTIASLTQQPVRREWWSILAWSALILLIIEWLVQYRGTLTWLLTQMRLRNRARQLKT